MMIWLLRHQVAGYLHEYPFASEPAAAQVAPIAAMLARRHGTHHPKTNEAYWLRAEPFTVVGPTEIPAPPLPGLGLSNGGAAPPNAVSATGTVHKPE